MRTIKNLLLALAIAAGLGMVPAASLAADEEVASGEGCCGYCPPFC